MNQKLSNEVKMFDLLISNKLQGESYALRLWNKIKDEIITPPSNKSHEEEICLALARAYDE
mgnify:CR=1 FL=1